MSLLNSLLYPNLNTSIADLFFNKAQKSIIVIHDRILVDETQSIVTSLNTTLYNATSNVTSYNAYLNMTSYGNESKLCGFPAFCSVDAIEACSNTTLVDCDVCSTSLAYLTFLVGLILSLAILLSNAVVMVTVSKQNHQLTNVDLQRFSLALADMLSGGCFLSVSPIRFKICFQFQCCSKAMEE